MEIKRMLIILSQKPALSMTRCGSNPVPKAMALGGVATGSIKAQEAPIPMIMAKPVGSTPNCSAMEIKIGTRSAAEAVLEVNSVRNTMKVYTNNPIMK